MDCCSYSSQTEFKIDTGADVTVIPEHVYKESRDGPLSSSDRILCGSSRHSTSIGQLSSHFTEKPIETKEEIYVVKELQKALLGRPAIESLELLIRVDEVLSSKSAAVSKFPQLITGMKGAYHIDLKADATPFALMVPRRVAIPLMEKVKTELQ